MKQCLPFCYDLGRPSPKQDLSSGTSQPSVGQENAPSQGPCSLQKGPEVAGSDTPRTAILSTPLFHASRAILQLQKTQTLFRKDIPPDALSRPIFSLLADKARAREYIERTIGAEYLVPCYLVCDQVTTETFEALPDSFVMKANHSSRQTRIVIDKSWEDLDNLARIANAWLKKDFSMMVREKHYSGIQPKIIFEKALLCNGKPPDDYKFNIFNGGPGNRPYVFIQVMQGRFEKN
ncbi:ATP-grasp fold amidoligase family protein [Azotobacter sp. CWF10]